MYLLIIDDNPDIVENFLEYFEEQGNIVDVAYNGLSGLQAALDNEYDVIVLDLMLPRMDGLEVCERLRKEGKTTPILMLTARDTLENKLEGFRTGADDYLVKPFALPEVEARVLALGRRRDNLSISPFLKLDDLELNLQTLDVTRAGKAIMLAPIALKILTLLMRRSPVVVSREEIEREVWGDNPPDSDTLRAHMYSLRLAIDQDFDIKLLHTIRGQGYQMAVKHAG